MSFGLISIIGCVIFVVFYLVILTLRKGAAWMTRDDAPKERVLPFVALSAIIGLLIGSMIQSLYDGSKPCREQGSSLVVCLSKM